MRGRKGRHAGRCCYALLAIKVRVHLVAVHARAVCPVKLDDAARLGDLDDREVAPAVGALHLNVELLVPDDEDDVDWCNGSGCEK